MSWSIYKVGKSDKLATVIAREIASVNLAEPENHVAAAATVLIAQALAANIPPSAVKVTAFGSQSKSGSKDGPDRVTNTLEIKIEQLGEFHE
jgi:hypothetical protein